jgi:PleD family two-component response regulator
LGMIPFGHNCDQRGPISGRVHRRLEAQATPNTRVHVPRPMLGHVLAVDDDDTIRQAVADYLSRHDFRVTAVADGRAMQGVLAQDAVDPHCVRPRPARGV